ncbi:MAG TPA: VOC family protein [Methylomirabilota bacterium]|nr:VOC family protein [Methylomirabilota bacterium]
MIASRLAYAALVVADVERVATAFTRDFGLRRTDCTAGNSRRSVPVFAVGSSALALFEPSDPFLGEDARPGVHHIALEVADLAAAAGAVSVAGVALDGRTPEPGLDGRRRFRLKPEATAGVRTYLSEPMAVAQASGGGWLERIDHIGVASADNAAAVEVFCGRLGFPLESTQTDLEVRIPVESFTSDKYGVIYHSRSPEPVGGLRVAFVTVGDCDIELLQDFDPRHGTEAAGHGAGTTKQDQGAIARFVASRGPGLHHLALKVGDIDDALGRLARAGYELIDRAGRPGSRRARIAFLARKSLGGVLVHLVERPAA